MMTMIGSLIKKPNQTIQFWGVRLDIPGDPSIKGRGGRGGGGVGVVVGGCVKILGSKFWRVVGIGDCKAYL